MRFFIIRILVSLIALLSMPVGAAKKQVPLPAILAGSMMPYDFSLTDSVPVWTDSLRPVYVARVARHGARYISSEKKVAKIKKELAEAEVIGSLTKEGHKFCSLLLKIEETTGSQWGRLSEVGYQEEQALAEDFYSLLPNLMKTARINAISSYVPRVVMTMYQFSHQLSAISSNISVSTNEGRQYDFLLRFFSTDSLYSSYRRNGNWTGIVERLTDSIVSPEPARRLLGAKCVLSDKELRAFTRGIYDILQSLSAFGMEAPTDEFMSESEYRACWEVDNLEHYLRNTITPFSSLAGKASSPLLARIIADAEASLGARLIDMTMKNADMASADAPSRYDANFYFGHAETLMPLLSLMRVEGCYDDSGDFANLSDRWKDYEIVPLGANIDLIFLQSPSLRIYVALRHNGRFVAPILGKMIVLWDDYKTYLTEIMVNLS